MKSVDFNTYAGLFLADMQAILDTKGADYTRGDAVDDRLSNFKAAAAEAGIRPEQVWFLYFHKQYSAVKAWVKTGKLESESLEARMHDIANYALLGAALARDLSGESPEKKS